MAYQNGEARCEVATSDRASKMSLGGDVFEDTALPVALQAHKLARRLGCSVEVATIVAELSGLGPREARR